MIISDDDFPSLFHAADSESLKAQRIYMRCMAADLGLIIIGGLFGAVSLEGFLPAEAHAFKLTSAIASATLMTLGLILTLYIRSRQFEHNWFDGRAVAESVKTTTWRFMVCSEPYVSAMTEKDVVRLFTDSLKKVVDERKRFAAFLASGYEEGRFQITPKMLEVRQLPLEEKKKLYLEERLNNQSKWYATKAEGNIKSSNRWFNAIVVAQALALLSTFVLMQYPELPIALPSVFATIAAAAVAWLQLRRHQELASAYGLAAQELSFIATQMSLVESADEFAGFVADAENAISREHTLWIARRDQV
jgi:SMODS and SLOG-associating 2TM effector domain 1/SMODS and SLOG-associating 2TM effector domain 3